MLPHFILILTGLLSVGFLSTGLAAVLRLPYSVFLVLLGLASGLLLNSSGHSASLELQAQFPDIILYLLLPPLIFESAYNMDWSAMRQDLVPIVSLSIGALLISTGMIAVGLHWLLRMDLLPAMVFGALISATDPVAVLALFKEVGAPKRLNTLVEGESLLNDGTAIVLFRVLTALLLAPQVHFSLMHTLGQFVYVALGGVAVGFSIVVLAVLFLRFTATSAAAQLGLTVATAYFSFVVADHFLGVSGVISTLTAGLFLGTRARLELSGEALHGMRALWDFLALSANALVFMMVGFEVQPDILMASLGSILPTLLVVYVARAISVPATLLPLNWLRWSEPIGLRYQAVLIWGGLRGGLALALALVLPVSFSERPLLLALATAVVLSTLLINALSIRPTLKALGLDTLNVLDEAFYRQSLAVALGNVFTPLRAAAQRGTLSEALLDTMQADSRAELLKVEEAGVLPARYEEAFQVQQVLLDEQHYYNDSLESGALSRHAYRVLTESVSNRLAEYRQHGMEVLKDWPFDFPLASPRATLLHSQAQQVRHLADTLEVLLHLEFGLLQLGPHCCELVDIWAARVRSRQDDLYRSYPQEGAAVQVRFVSNTVAASAQHVLRGMFEADVISGLVYSRAVSRIAEVHQRQVDGSLALLHPRLEQLLPSVPLLRDVPPQTVADLAMVAKRRQYPTGTAVVSEGEEGDSFFIVLSGLLEVRGSAFGDRTDLIRLFAGSYFGEMSLLFGLRRSATIVCLLPSELAELDRFTFETLMRTHPQVAEAVRKSAWERLSQLDAARGVPPPPDTP